MTNYFLGHLAPAALSLSHCDRSSSLLYWLSLPWYFSLFGDRNSNWLQIIYLHAIYRNCSRNGTAQVD